MYNDVQFKGLTCAWWLIIYIILNAQTAVMAEDGILRAYGEPNDGWVPELEMQRTQTGYSGQISLTAESTNTSPCFWLRVAPTVTCRITIVGATGKISRQNERKALDKKLVLQRIVFTNVFNGYPIYHDSRIWLYCDPRLLNPVESFYLSGLKPSHNSRAIYLEIELLLYKLRKNVGHANLVTWNPIKLQLRESSDSKVPVPSSQTGPSKEIRARGPGSESMHFQRFWYWLVLGVLAVIVLAYFWRFCRKH